MAIERMPEGTLELFNRDETVCQYVDMLISRGVDLGLIGPSEDERIWSRHILNCAALARHIRQDARVADIGSGAGLPGIVLAIARPDLSITLIESLERRANFLELAVDELRIGDRVRVIRERSENVTEKFDVVTARAVAALPKLLGFSEHLFMPQGELVALKGKCASAEVAKSKAKLKKMRCTAEVIETKALRNSEPTWIVKVSREVK